MHYENIKNVILFFIIGVPFVTGIWFRVFKFQKKTFLKNLYVTLFVFAAVGVGYSFSIQSKPPISYITIGRFIIAAIVFFLIPYIANHIERANDGTDANFWTFLTFFMAVIAYIGTGKAIQLGYSAFIAGVTAVSALMLLGGVNSILGSAATGFTFSSIIWAYASGEDYNSAILWKNVFEVLKIDPGPLRILILIACTLSSAGEALYDFIENWR